MLGPIESAAHRYRGYATEVIAPAVYRDREALDVGVFQPGAPVPCAVDADYRPVALGWQWGPAWSTCWFRLRGLVPTRFRGSNVALRFDCGTEALLWIDGAPHHGFDRNRDSCALISNAAGGESVELFIEAACHHGLGVTGFWWDDAETRARWQSATPGRLRRAELVIVDERVERLLATYELAHRLLVELEPDTPRAHGLNAALRDATALIDDQDVAASAEPSLSLLRPALCAGSAPSASRCVAVGHAHIDTAWLWTIADTRRKCIRTFTNVLRLMEQHPDLHFLCSQAQQYAWVEADAPAVFDAIRDRVADGRWEATGAMWIEPDCNVPSGESLVRQVLYGVRFWQSRFGADAPQRLLYLPDTFGFTAALPQIMALAGLDTFVTNKLSWSERNVFPHVSFRWRGLDGTEVLAHCTPGHDYNAALLPHELRRGERNLAVHGDGRRTTWLQPFGFGNGGGGPTAEMIERGRLASAIEGLPAVELGPAGRFADALHAERAALRRTGHDLPVWDGELYLELHRGTYTTQAWLKSANRDAEEALRTAEWLGAAGPAGSNALALDEPWQLLLLNQFHDILPGTSIAPVYADARRDHARIESITTRAVQDGVTAWASQADTRGRRDPMLVLNPSSTPRSGVVQCADALHYAREVPALGMAVLERGSAPALPPVRVTERSIANGIIEAHVDDAGRLVSVSRVRDGREASAGPLNQLVLYEDRPRSWDAWDIDPEYVDRAMPVDGPATSIRVVEDHPLRGAIEVTRLLGHDSAITQRYVLDAGSPRLDIQTHVRWQESRRLLRALFPVNVRARRATYEVQFGHVERATHDNTSWEQAMFEVCGHAWMDLSEPGLGVAILNDGKYGHSCHENVMGLSLLRAPSFPDPNADRGEHRFTYSIMVHGGDWRAAGVDREAHALNVPLLARQLPPDQPGAITDTWAPFTIDGDNAAGIVVSACKTAEDDDRLIVRLVETHGGAGTVRLTWSRPVTSVESVDLLERPRAEGVLHTDGVTTAWVRPFQILTLAAAVDR